MVLSVSMGYAADVSFEWTGNTEQDLDGYHLYQGLNTGGPYTQVTVEGDIDAGDVTWTLPGVPDGTFFWVLTAFDMDGNESGYSNECWLRVDTSAPDAPTDFHCFIGSGSQ